MYFLSTVCLLMTAISNCNGAGLCDLDLIPLHSNFKMNSFLGSWYEVERSELAWGHNTWHGAVWTIFEARNGTKFFSYTGHRTGQDCNVPQTGFFTDTSLDGRVTLTSESGLYEMTFQVAYTDYNHVALVYMCYEALSTGVCHTNKLHVAFMSRVESLTMPQRVKLVSLLEPTCITESDIVASTTGACIAPTPNPILVG
ncbi:uncharacterized protein LOC128205267 [Mya arenaria]|uniref:uncharacterized protein LOC128205267 n=1 Tax=Mya arenaria TaxID=6604 RepID=UPI0022E29E53|nr:uncharacterized protein LOC128205267 [Mya arenaria]